MNKRSIKILIFLVSLIVIGLVVYELVKIVLPDSNVSLYGNRQEATVKISDDRINQTTTLIKGNEFINSAKTYIGGVLIVNIVIDVKKDTKLLTIESMLDKVLELYTEKEKADYDFQVFVTCKEDTSEDSAYPIIGYKHKTGLAFKWTNNS